MATASQAQMHTLADLIRLGFGVQWTTDHEMLLAERTLTEDLKNQLVERGMSEEEISSMYPLTPEQKAQCQESWAEMALELNDYHSEQ